MIIPEIFGIKGDGITDDTAAIQSFIEYITEINNNNVEFVLKFITKDWVFKPILFYKRLD